MPLTDFLAIYDSYNLSFGLATPVLFVLALAAIGLVFFKPGAMANIVVKSILALIWAYTSIVFFVLFYAPINPAGYTMAAFFLLMAIILIVDIFVKRLDFDVKFNSYVTYGSIAMMAIGLIVYPLLSIVGGRPFPSLSLFGDPATISIFTIGILMLTVKNSRMGFFMVPLFWSLVGGFGSGGLLGLGDGYLLAICGLTGLGISWYYHYIQQEDMKKAAQKLHDKQKRKKKPKPA